MQNWFVNVLVKEKSPIRHSQWGKQQKIVFADKENTVMQCTTYEHDVDQLDKVLQLYKTYFVGNGRIRELSESSFAFTHSKYQMTLNRSAYIKPANKEQELSIEHIYELTTFAKASHFADQRNKQINLLCAVIHVFPPQFIQKNKKSVQEFVIVNEEISVGTLPNSTILLNPPISEAAQLQTWLISNKEYVEAIVNDRLYEKQNQNIELPLTSEIRKISQIISLSEMVKSYWIKAHIPITKSDQQLYFLSCPTCSKSCGACYKNDFTCLYCGNDFQEGPKPLLRFQVQLRDTTGTLEAFIGGKEAETLVGMTANELAEADLQGTRISSAQVNERIKNQLLLFHIKTSTNEFRGQKYVRNTIIACIPPAESSSASQFSGQTSTSSDTQISHADLPSQTIMPLTSSPPTTTKRSIDFAEEPPHSPIQSLNHGKHN